MYDNGLLAGLMITYFENGKVQRKYNMINDQEEGLHEQFNEDGDLLRSYVIKNDQI